jgi:chemotaxis protein CheD
MNGQQQIRDIYLTPGELHFGDHRTRIRTLLGSCVSVVLWHPGLLVGGMCHFMLPSRNMPSLGLDGRYADEAMVLLLDSVETHGAPRREYQVKLFGGSNMFGNTASGASVGLKNINAARRLIDTHGFKLTGEHLGGGGHRNIVFEVWSGDVWMKHVSV